MVEVQKEVDISKLQMINRVAIKLTSPMQNQISFNNGKLWIDTSYHPQDHVTVSGEVVALPKSLYFAPSNPRDSMPWRTSSEVQVGDIAYFNYHAMLMVLGRMADESVMFADECYWMSKPEDPKNSELYVFLKYEYLYFVKRPEEGGGESVIMLNGYLLIEPTLVNPISSKMGLWLPGGSEYKIFENRATVRYLGTPNEEYIADKDDATEIAVDQEVVHRPRVRLKVENDLHRTFKWDIHVIQRSDVLACIEKN